MTILYHKIRKISIHLQKISFLGPVSRRKFFRYETFPKNEKCDIIGEKNSFGDDRARTEKSCFFAPSLKTAKKQIKEGMKT